MRSGAFQSLLTFQPLLSAATRGLAAWIVRLPELRARVPSCAPRLLALVAGSDDAVQFPPRHSFFNFSSI
jgi:hypothetical protein